MVNKNVVACVLKKWEKKVYQKGRMTITFSSTVKYPYAGQCSKFEMQ